MKVAAFALLAVVTTSAPLQCGGKNADLELRREDTAGDALFALALKFKNEGNSQSAKATLEYLIAQYPSSRRIEAARDELRALGGSAGSSANAPSP